MILTNRVLATGAILTTAVTAFVMLPTPDPTAPLRAKLSDIDEACVESVAEFCLQAGAAVDECDVEEYEALINQLSEQRDSLAEHLQYIDNLLVKLKGAKTEENTFIDG